MISKQLSSCCPDGTAQASGACRDVCSGIDVATQRTAKLAMSSRFKRCLSALLYTCCRVVSLQPKLSPFIVPLGLFALPPSLGRSCLFEPKNFGKRRQARDGSPS